MIKLIKWMAESLPINQKGDTILDGGFCLPSELEKQAPPYSLIEEGFFLTPTELATRERKAFEAGSTFNNFSDYQNSEEYKK